MFNLVKIGRNRTDVYDAASREYLCQLLNREVSSWVHSATRARVEATEDAARLLSYRRARAAEYLAARAARPATAQLTLI